MNTLDSTALIVHLVATAAMGGLIWFVQVVHYPLFAAVGADGFDAGRARTLVRTNWIRTVGWSFRGIIAAVMVGQALTR